jgi:hypothetical protein
MNYLMAKKYILLPVAILGFAAIAGLCILLHEGSLAVPKVPREVT